MRPSDIIGLQNSYEAWCFNNAVYYFGQSLESELRAIKPDAKNQEGKRSLILSRYMPDSSRGLFRDPASAK